MSYTKGPWKAEQSRMAEKIQIQVWADGMQIATVSGLAGFDYANSSLIAAAPELLHACKDILDFLYRSGYDTTLVKDAIAKAEGK